MSDLKSFISKVKRGEVAKVSLPARQDMYMEISSALHGYTIGSSQETERFKKEVSETANSEEVITTLSDALGQPRTGETEEEFVARGKAILKKILMKKFSE
jgi:uncharacterized protein (UPF0335 family)